MGGGQKFHLLAMKVVLLVVLLACLGLVSCQISLVTPPGRGYNFGDSRHGPCGIAPVEVGDRIGWEESSIQQIEVQVIGAAGGGVIVDRWSCVRNGDEENPLEPILPIEGNLRVKVPDFDFQVYRLFVRTPSIRCRGEATMQLVYATDNGPEFFQCQDVVITSGASTVAMSVFALFVAVAMMVL